MKTLLFLGDSITDSHRLFLDVPHTLGDGFVWNIRQQLPEEHYTLINRGHDGFTVRDLLRRIDHDCLAFDADIITILIGVNDIAAEIFGEYHSIPEDFHTTYRTLLEKISSAKPAAKLILMEPFVFSRPSEFLAFHPYVELERQCIQQLAKEFHAEFFPLHKLMNSQNDNLGGSPLTCDGIHLSKEGNELLANYWLNRAQTFLV